MDKMHKETDRKLLQTKKQTRTLYLNNYLELKKNFANEYNKFNLNKDMTSQQKFDEVNKYGRLDKLANDITEQILETNKEAVKNVNNLIADVYKDNYNYMVEQLNIGTEQINKTEAKEDVKETANPFNAIAIENAKDKDQIKRKVKSALLNSILKTATVGGAFVSLKGIYENNLSSMLTMAITQATHFENLARYDAMIEAERRAEKFDRILVKRWRSQGDDKVRDAHARADGQDAKVDEPFYVGGEPLMYPGDINGSPGNIINCRCYIEYDFLKK